MFVTVLSASAFFLMGMTEIPPSYPMEISHRVAAYCSEEGPRHALSRHYRARLRHELIVLQGRTQWNFLDHELKERVTLIVQDRACG